MDENENPANRFEEQRSRLRAVAYRILDSPAEADDVVQEASAQLSQTDTRVIENLQAWLTTVVARVAANMPEAPLDVHLPDLIIDSAEGADPEHEAMLAGSVGLARLLVLETLSPAERLAFVLHDMFAPLLNPDVDVGLRAFPAMHTELHRREPGHGNGHERGILDPMLKIG